MLSSTNDAREEEIQRYKEKIPGPMSNEFTEKLSRDEAIARQDVRKRRVTALFPSRKFWM